MPALSCPAHIMLRPSLFKCDGKAQGLSICCLRVARPPDSELSGLTCKFFSTLCTLRPEYIGLCFLQ